MTNSDAIAKAQVQFAVMLEEQLARIERIKKQSVVTDYTKLDKVVIGILGGDGIGPFIAEEAERVLETLLADAVAAGKVEFRVLDGLTIENRAAHLKAIPDDVLAAIKDCHVTLKGPTTTPEKGDEWPNIESCNVGNEEGAGPVRQHPARAHSQGGHRLDFLPGKHGGHVRRRYEGGQCN